ncbi:transposase [Clostridium arbusti]|uniref:transposase n=1 Tax=Clostridium arbusti TaxID=1137848 RepID=UPI0009DA1D36|nr:transposase [Clostridium arbusti]
MSTVKIFHFYNKQQTIETFFKMVKNVYHIKNLRTSKFYGIYSFLWIVFIIHNLISYFKSTILYETKLENMGVRVLVNIFILNFTTKNNMKNFPEYLYIYLMP